MLTRYVAILDVLVNARRPLTVLEIAQGAGLPTSTTYRLLVQLQANRLVAHQASDGRIWLGLKCLEYGGATLEALSVRDIARPVIRRLSEGTGETVHLTTRDGDEGVFVEKVEAQKGLFRWHTEIGRRAPLYAGASMKVILAFMQPVELNQVLGRMNLEKLAPGTIVNRDQLIENLAVIRRRGWASSVEEMNEGAAGVSAPIFDHDNEIAAGLTITGPTSRICGIRLQGLARLVVASAAEISVGLGYGRGQRRAAADRGSLAKAPPRKASKMEKVKNA